MSVSTAFETANSTAAIQPRFSLLDRFFQEDTSAHASLCSCLSPKDLAMLRRTNRFIGGEVAAYYQRAFSINRILQPYFDYPLEFRALQANTGTLISGSAALQFFDRTEYAGSDLDLYVEHCYARKVIHFLVDEGYGFRASARQPPTLETAMAEATLRALGGVSALHQVDEEDYVGGGLVTVLRFTQGQRDIHVITAFKSPLTVIFNFHSTCVMNIITHEKAYGLFPRATFETRESLVIDRTRNGNYYKLARQKYVSRGWKMVYDRPGNQIDFTKSARWIGDSETWTIQLTPSFNFPPDCREISGFLLIHPEHKGSVLTHTILEDTSLCHNLVLNWIDNVMISDGIAKLKAEMRARSLPVGRRIDELLCEYVKNKRLGHVETNLTELNLGLLGLNLGQ